MEDDNKPDDMEADVAAAIASLSGEKPAETAQAAPTEALASEDKQPEAEQKPSGERERDEHGRFKAKDAKQDDKPAEGDQQPAATEKPAVAQDVQPATEAAPPAAAANAAPPSSWSVAAKAAWDALPPAVREAIAKRESEVSSGFAQYAEFKGLQQYSEMAKASGTTLKAALDAYVGIDQLLQQDAAKGFAAIAQNIGLDNARAAQLFAHLAQQMGHQFTPAANQTAAGAPPAGQGAGNGVAPDLVQVLQPVLQQHLAPHLKEIESLKQTLQQRTEADQKARQQQAEAIATEFAADPKNRFYHNLEGDIAALLTTGLVAGGAIVKVQRTGDFRRDLQAAYDQACKLHPEVSAELSKAQRAKEDAERKAKEAEAAAKAKAASKSLTGNRMPGSTVKEENKAGGAMDDIEADVRAAMRQLSA